MWHAVELWNDGCVIFLIVELSMLQRLEATSQFSACIAERWNCVCFLLSSQDDEVGHISVDFFNDIC